MSAVGPIQSPALPQLDSLQKPREASTDFGGAFVGALRDAKELEAASQEASARFANNDQTMGIHEVVIANEKANIAVRYATTLRSKALEAYRELMNTQV